MSKLIYITNMSLNGYIEDETGAFDWIVDQEIHEYITNLMRPIGTYLCGRRLHETMDYWNATPIAEYPAERRDFARRWQNIEKIVFSRTLADVTAPNTRLERNFDPEAIQKLKSESITDITVGGAELAGLALDADLVDECQLFVHPVVVGGGKPAFRPGLRRNLELLETRRFGTGVVHLHYRVAGRS